MSGRRRTGVAVLGLLVALAALLGVACLCTHGQAMHAESVAFASVTHDRPHGPAYDHTCLAPGHEQCSGKLAVDTPGTGPGPHPQPIALPAQGDARPASPATSITRYVARPRAPDLHVLQVLRT
jgi:hypothetical protein